MGSAPAAGRYRLGVDFGTSHTVAVLCWPDGRTRPLLFDGTPQLSSAVFADVDGRLHVGRAAHRAARTHPERLEPYPKRCIGLERVFLGTEPGVPVVALVEAVLRRVADEAARVTAGVAPRVVLSHPAGWGPRRRATLLTAAQRVFDQPLLVPEPVAAAAHFVGAAGHRTPDCGHALVYDLGAGTFDATVVRRTGTGFHVLATAGLVDAGGLDVDAAIVASLGTVHGGRNPAMWARLTHPRTVEDRRAARALWEEVRAAKEALSSEAAAVVAVPLFDEEAPLGREQLDALAGPVLERTVEATREVLRDARLPAGALAGLFLTGGGSRSPLVGTLLHRRLGVVPVAVEQPELAVAEGCARIAPPPERPVPHGAPPPAGAAAPPPFATAAAATPPFAAGVGAAPPSSAGPAVAAPNPSGRAGGAGWGGATPSEWAVAGVAALVVILLFALVLAIALPDGDDGTRDRTDDGVNGALPGTTSATGAPAAGDLDPCLVGSWLVTEHVLPYYGWRLRGSGQTLRIDSAGRFVLDHGTATVYRGPLELGTFRLSVSGTITHDVVTADGTIHTRNTRASGTVTADSGLGGVPPTEQKLAGQPGPFGYRCAGDAFTLDAGQGQTLTMTRAGTR